MQGSSGTPATGSRGGTQGSGRRGGGGWSPVVVLLIVFGITLVTEFAVEGILGQQAAAQGVQSANSCAVSFWIFQLGCSTSWQANPQAQAAAQLGQQLILPFVVVDVVFILAVVYVVALSVRNRSSGRQIGTGRHR